MSDSSVTSTEKEQGEFEQAERGCSVSLHNMSASTRLLHVLSVKLQSLTFFLALLSLYCIASLLPHVLLCTTLYLALLVTFRRVLNVLSLKFRISND